MKLDIGSGVQGSRRDGGKDHKETLGGMAVSITLIVVMVS